MENDFPIFTATKLGWQFLHLHKSVLGMQLQVCLSKKKWHSTDHLN